MIYKTGCILISKHVPIEFTMIEYVSVQCDCLFYAHCTQCDYISVKVYNENEKDIYAFLC